MIKTIIKILTGFSRHPRINRLIEKIPLLKPLRKILFDFLFKDKIFNINNSKMFLDLEREFGNIGYLDNYEQSVVKIIRQEVKKGDIVMDLGANIGYYSLLFAKLVGNEGKVFAFEPDPNNFTLFEKNIKINDYQNIVPIQGAVSDKNGDTSLFLIKGNPGESTIGKSSNMKDSVMVKSVRLDDYFPNLKIDFIKMDIEGAEMSMIRGAKNLLERNENIKIILEFNPIALRNNGENPLGFLKTLMGLGFRIWNIEKRLSSINPDDLTKFYLETIKGHINLFCIK